MKNVKSKDFQKGSPSDPRHTIRRMDQQSWTDVTVLITQSLQLWTDVLHATREKINTANQR